jgi:hypothetical protein
MRYLENFCNYLNESVGFDDLSKEELDEMLLPIRDLDIEYSYSPPRTITEGEYEGYTSMNITFRNNFKTGAMGGYTEMIIDDRFWEFLDEIIAFKNRLESVQVSINTNWKWGIVLSFIQNSKVDGDLFKMQKLYNEMSKRTSVSKSDFSNGMVKRLDKENMTIIVRCSDGYTDRKWNSLFRDVDFSEFNVEKNISEPDRWGLRTGVITITLKK